MRTVATALIVSSGSGRGIEPDEIVGRFHGFGVGVQVFERESMVRVAEAAPERIVVAGGDGSIGPAAELASRTRAPLAVLPVGTANNFAAAKGIPRDLDDACLLAARGERTEPAELGRAGDVPFVNLASAGLAPVAAARAARWKKALGPAAYTVGAVSAALTTPPIACEVKGDGRREFAGESWQLMVAATGAFGAGVRVEGTDPADGALDLVVFEAGPRRTLLRRGWRMRQGRVGSQPGAVRARAPSFEVDVPAGTRFNVDGEVLELGPTRFTVEPEPFRLVVPR
jgi:diacylglycerol kinase (ATP)